MPSRPKLADTHPDTYGSYFCMVQRCHYTTSRDYPRYGGRGIKVCDRWRGRGGFARFLEDMGPRPEGHTIDRIDNDGEYTPENCRWATHLEQNNNRQHNVTVTLHGATMTVGTWAYLLDIHPTVIHARLKRGDAPERALRTDVAPYIKRTT
jgi:hypothetical protein